MPREKEFYRDCLEDILKFSGDRRILTAKEVAGYTGKDVRTVKKRFCIGPDGISAMALARKMASL